jgi:hypothetical protein
MDLSTATGMRLTDCCKILLPRGDVLTLEASKSGKAADFDLSLSAVLRDLIERQRAIKATHLTLRSTPSGRPVTLRMLRDRWTTREPRLQLRSIAGLAKRKARHARTCSSSHVASAWLTTITLAGRRQLSWPVEARRR